MSLEEALKANTAALEANTAALKAAGTAPTAATPAADKPAGGKKAAADKPAAAAKSKHSREEMTAALVKLKEKHGMDEAKAALKAGGHEGKMAEVPDDKIDAVHDAAVAAYDKLEAGTTDADDDI